MKNRIRLPKNSLSSERSFADIGLCQTGKHRSLTLGLIKELSKEAA